MNLSEKFILGCRYVLPSPFSIAILLTLLTAGLAWGLTAPTSQTTSAILQIGQYWQKGFWDLLTFTMQMMLILVLGHALALSPVLSRLIHRVSRLCDSTSKAAFFVCLITMTFGLLNWGLGLIIGAVFARKIGDQAAHQGNVINYPLVGAAGYIGMLVWHGGLSGSATLKVAEPDHFLISQMGQLPVTETIFSFMNMSVNLALLIILPLLFYWLGKNTSNYQCPNLPKDLTNAEPPTPSVNPIGAEKLDLSPWFSKFFAILMLCQAIYIAFIVPEHISLNFLSLNFINFILFAFGLLAFKNIQSYMLALEEAIVGSVGILIQFPLYAGIAGIIQYSGLIHVFSDFIVEVATQQTYPLYVMLSSALVNIFVPSGGGQWAVQGPILVEAATALNVPKASGIMAFAYGDQLTNMLQPFWALPLLGITKLKAYQVLPYTVLCMLIGFIVFGLGLWFLA
tara:strand:+ start:259504 stop:260865 length:1362 start_codon:yes stop_codon:yes gene_type:complete